MLSTFLSIEVSIFAFPHFPVQVRLLFFLWRSEAVRSMCRRGAMQTDCVKKCFREMFKSALHTMVDLDRCDTELSSSLNILMAIF